MFGRNIRSAVINSSVLEAEDDARRQRDHEEYVASIRRRQLAFDTQQREAEEARHQREVDATTAKREQEQRKAEALQAAQWAWAARRSELRDEVAALRTAIRTAEDRMLTAPMSEATAAASERDVLEHRLTAIEAEYARHVAAQPA